MAVDRFGQIRRDDQQVRAGAEVGLQIRDGAAGARRPRCGRRAADADPLFSFDASRLTRSPSTDFRRRIGGRQLRRVEGARRS